MKKGKHIGKKFNDWLEEEGIAESVHAVAEKKIIAYQFAEAMRKQKVSVSALAARMGTSRTIVHRVLSPKAAVTTDTLIKAAHALGKECRFELV